MKIHISQRHQSNIKIGLQGPSGSGKTYSALLLAKGLVGDWTKILVIDTEHGSSNLYAHLGQYSVIELAPPFNPERYIEAIQMAAEAGMECIILDSISHCWEFLLDYHATLPGNSFTNWAKVTPRQMAFVNAILSVPAHVIATMRSKQDYVLNQKDGKYIPEKVGLKSIQRDGIEYEFTLSFDLDYKHLGTVSKDRTGLFGAKAEYHGFMIKEYHGKMIRDWTKGDKDIKAEIINCTSLDQLRNLYQVRRPTSKDIVDLFAQQKKILQTKIMTENGTTTNS